MSAHRCSLLFIVFSFVSLFAGDFQLDPKPSVFAVVTQKAGFAAGLAHNHFVAADPVKLTLSCEADPLSSLKLEFSTKVEDLKVDDNTITQTWTPRVQALAFLEGGFGEVPEKDRTKIRKSMLGKKQLKSDQHSEITAKLVSIKEKASTQGSVAFSHELEMDITITGQTQRKAVAANVSLSENRLKIEAFCQLTFSEFTIKPYSAAFGAVANADTFYLLVHLEATPSPE